MDNTHSIKYILLKHSIVNFALLTFVMWDVIAKLLSDVHLQTQLYVGLNGPCVHCRAVTHRHLRAETCLGVDPSDIRNPLQYGLYNTRKMTQRHGH